MPAFGFPADPPASDRPTTELPASARPLRPGTVAVTAGRPPHLPDSPLNVPLTMASTYVAGGDLEYGRYGNPTWSAFEEALGALEGGRCLAFSSGLAAVATVLDLVGQGRKVVAPRHAYNGSVMQLADLEARGRITVHLVDIEDTAAVIAACEDAALVWLESPTNPALEVADLVPIIASAHEAGAYVVVDNTFATPLLQQPLALGADLVVHSATKFIAGHSDVLLGAVLTSDDELAAVLRKRRELLGAVPGTLEAWLALRGLRTLHVRLERAQANAQELVRRLGGHAAVGEVRYPGFGAIVSVVLAQGALAADLLTHKTSLWVHATSLGGVESTFERRRRWKSEPATIPEGLVRMSVGIEDVDDLWDDLAGALDDLTGEPPAPAVEAPGPLGSP
ncbi:trans-sulfuration enzyme family protein [Nocardioides mesophilus]|uniref:homocysteine desulfhydrase n=1 Tax=Nocardioides mesophilus TaxID=433659 RepID=A0A7G9R916_9ACTN|nr:aminotransferase class I/II-fold pyridoxal phosphate-dependent enzyme [Nocardioides mesophilus]QNN52091.1 aminotransferase class I/II-fold pyridoxal phosphate-dependent enzyme [Nocardioides mesophilus]